MSSKIKSMLFKYKLALIGTGMCVGWLSGMSVSPIISIVISSLIGVIASLVAFLSGLKQGEAENQAQPVVSKLSRVSVNPIPVFLLLIGLIIGAGIGVITRTNSWLGISLDNEIEKWRITGWPDSVIAQRIFVSQYGDITVVSDTLVIPSLKKEQNITPESVYFKKEDQVLSGFTKAVIKHKIYSSKSEPQIDNKKNDFKIPILFSISSTDCNKICGSTAKNMFYDLIRSGKRDLLDSLLSASRNDSLVVFDKLKFRCKCGE